MSAVGVVFSNIHDENVPELSRQRTMGSLPFGGRYRLIDFALSNLVNSGVTTVGIITKNNYQSLMDHLGSGKDWDLARKTGGLVLLPPFGNDNGGLYKNRLEALKGITGFLNRRNEDYVILCDCDGVYRMDFSDVIDYHEEKQADITVVCHTEEIANSDFYTVVEVDKNNRVTDLKINEKVTGSSHFYSNIMVIGRSFLLSNINDAIARGYNSFREDVIMKNLKGLKIYTYDFEGYYATIDSFGSYFKHNMELLDKQIRDELFGARDIYTKVRDSAPSKYGDSAVVRNSLVSDGCIVEGTVENSILFRGVKVGKGSVVKNSIIMQDTVIGENVSLNCVVTDKNVVIRDRRMLSGCEIQPYFLPKGSMV